MNFLSVFLLVLAAFLPVGSVAASAPQQGFAEGVRLFGEGKFEAAHDLLFQAFLNDPGLPEINFLLGRCAFEKGDYESAVMAYERVMIAAGDHHRVKLELARSYLALNSLAEARQYFVEVLAENPPDAVRENIGAYLAFIDKAEQAHILHGAVSVGVSHDDNVGAAPAETAIPVPALANIPVEVDGSESDVVHHSSLMINHVYKFGQSGRYAWKTTGVLYNAFHETGEQHDINYLGLSTGAVRIDGRQRWEVYSLFNQINLGYDRYMHSPGIGLSFTGQNAAGALATATFSVETKRFPADPGKNAVYSNLPLTISHAIGDSRFTLGVSAEHENAEVDTNSLWRYGANFRYDLSLLADFGLFASLRWQAAEYREADASFLVRRRDRMNIYTAGCSRIFWMNPARERSLTGLLTHTYTDSRSNILLYDYDRNVTSVSMTFSF